MAVTQVRFQKGSGYALCERGFVAAVGPHAIALFAHDDGCARVLTHGEDAACGDVGIFEHFNGDKAVVVRGFGVVEYFGQLFQVCRAEQVRAVSYGAVRQHGQALGFDFEDFLALKLPR